MFEQYQSLEDALRTLYPTYSWDASEFLKWRRLHRGHWSDPSSQRAFLDRVADKLGLSQVLLSHITRRLSCLFCSGRSGIGYLDQTSYNKEERTSSCIIKLYRMLFKLSTPNYHGSPKSFYPNCQPSIGTPTNSWEY